MSAVSLEVNTHSNGDISGVVLIAILTETGRDFPLYLLSSFGAVRGNWRS